MATLKIASVEIEVAVGTTIPQVCDEHETAIIFGCRAATCGACMIRVVEGRDNLSPPGSRELDLLAILAAGPDRRLACQCVVLDDVAIEAAD